MESHTEKVDQFDGTEEVNADYCKDDVEDAMKWHVKEDTEAIIEAQQMKNFSDISSARHPLCEATANTESGSNGVAEFNHNLSAIGNLRNLTLSLDLIHINLIYTIVF